MRITNRYGEVCIPTYQKGCNNSERILHRDSHASSSHEPSLEPKRSVDLEKHSIYSCSLPERPKLRDLPEDQNHKGAVQKTYWQSRISCRKFWKFDCSLSQSRQWRVWILKQSSFCSRGAGLASQWIQSYPCETKISQETERSLRKFLMPDRKLKVIYTDSSLEFGKACEDLSWNHCTSTPHRSETNGIAERAVRRVKEGTSAVLFNHVWMRKRWADSMDCGTFKISCLMGRHHMEDAGQGDGVPKAGRQQTAAGSRGFRTCVCANTQTGGVAHAGEEGWIDILPWYRLVGVAKTSSQTQRRKSRAARKVRGTDRPPTCPGSAPR